MPQSSLITRRELLQSAAMLTGGAALARKRGTEARGTRHALGGPQQPPEKPTLPTRPFGKTGRQVCMLALGTGLIAQDREFDEAVGIIRHALDCGITYIDTAESYGSEKQVGAAIAGRRKGLFLATKTLRRDYDGAMRELEQSLRLLGTDHLDLWQVHSIGHEGRSGEQEVATLRKPDSVMKAMRKARQEGTVDFVGFTGHTKPEYMLQVMAADDLDFDTMLFVISAAVAREDSRDWEQKVLPAGRQKNLGLIAMKVFGGGKAVGEGEERAKPAELLSYVWDRGLRVANVGLYTKPQVDAAVAALALTHPEPSRARAEGQGGTCSRPPRTRSACVFTTSDCRSSTPIIATACEFDPSAAWPLGVKRGRV